MIVLDDEDGGGRGGQQLRQQQQRRRSQGAAGKEGAAKTRAEKQQVCTYVPFHQQPFPAELPPYLTADGVLRLVRLRNPWGTREWTGR